MIRVAWSHLRRRIGRTLALLLAIGLATTSFVLLTGAAETTRLQVRGSVEQNFRSSYDLLVRPTSSYTALENERSLVRPNYQSGIFGGITTDQLAAIRSVNGVEVAAPVANLGYLNFSGVVEAPIRPYLNGDTQQLFRVRPTWTMDRGTSTFVGAPTYVYVSTNPTTVLKSIPNTRQLEFSPAGPTYAEVVPKRRRPVPGCTNYEIDQEAANAKSDRPRTPFVYRDPYGLNGPRLDCYYTHTVPPQSLDAPQGAADPGDLDTSITVPFPVLLTAIDPEAEAQLSGLDQAIVSGRALTADDRVTKDQRFKNPVIPLLAASTIDVDQQVSATVERVRPQPGRRLSDVLTGQTGAVARVAALPGTTIDTIPPVDAPAIYADLLPRVTDKAYGIGFGGYWTVGTSTYTSKGNKRLAVKPVINPKSVYATSQIPGDAPVGSDDVAFRPVTGHPVRHDQQDYVGFGVVGQFDPAKIRAEGSLSGLTAQTYVSPLLPGADAASRAALGGRPLAPSTNLGGYPAQSPTLLTTLAAAKSLLDSQRFQGADASAPISVVRVRVRDVHGTDPVSRERLNQAALAITQQSGLAVDIVAGASGVPITIALPAGDHGRPALNLIENWARKGVAYEVVDAVDRKSVALFVLILTVCALVVGNAASASVHARRSELGVLSCLGWRAGRLFGVVVAELAAVGAAAGLVGAAVALPAASLAGLPVSAARAAVVVPTAVVLAALAGLLPAVRAARAAPLDAIRPLVVPPRRAVRVRSVAGLAAQCLRRTPGRTVLAAASLAIGVAAVVVLVAVQSVFRGLVVGSLLGNAVTVPGPRARRGRAGRRRAAGRGRSSRRALPGDAGTGRRIRRPPLHRLDRGGAVRPRPRPGSDPRRPRRPRRSRSGRGGPWPPSSARSTSG